MLAARTLGVAASITLTVAACGGPNASDYCPNGAFGDLDECPALDDNRVDCSRDVPPEMTELCGEACRQHLTEDCGFTYIDDP